MRKLTTILGLVLTLALSLVATMGRPQPAQAAADSLVLLWNEEALESVRKLPPGPTITARALAVVHTAIYDAWAAYDPVAVDTRQRLRANPDLRQPAAERTQANKERAVSFAAYTALVDLFPARTAYSTSAWPRSAMSPTAPTRPTPATVGATAAQAVLDFRHADGSNQLNGYTDPSTRRLSAGQHLGPDPGRRPLAAAVCAHPTARRHHLRGRVQPFLTPHWRNVAPFALTSAEPVPQPRTGDLVDR